MRFLRLILHRLTDQRAFFYNWEQRAYERRQEQYRSLFQSTCRLGKD